MSARESAGTPAATKRNSDEDRGPAPVVSVFEELGGGLGSSIGRGALGVEGTDDGDDGGEVRGVLPKAGLAEKEILIAVGEVIVEVNARAPETSICDRLGYGIDEAI